MSRPVPLRRSLVARLVGTSLLVAIVAIAATAWLVARTTSAEIHRNQGRGLLDDPIIYDRVVEYAATHPDWDDVGPVLDALARRFGYRIALTTLEGRPLADSGPAGPLPDRASAVVDPLQVDLTLVSDPAPDRIDVRAVGPFRLSGTDRETLRDAAGRSVACLRRNGLDARVEEAPNGRPRVAVTSNDPEGLARTTCAQPLLRDGTARERRALADLNALADECLRARRARTSVLVNLDLSWRKTRDLLAAEDATVAECLEIARRNQLQKYVAPGALLFVADRDGDAEGAVRFSLLDSPRSLAAALAVFLATLLVTVLAAIRLIRPLRALTTAAQTIRAGGSQVSVDVSRSDEIGELAAAFNDMSAHRDLLESQRRALVSDVSHELRTPLSNIRGWLEAAQDGLAQPDEALLDSLLEEAMLLQHLVDDLRDLAMADTGHLPLHPEPVELRDLLERCTTAHAAAATAAGVRLRTRVRADGRGPDLLADPLRLRQAVGNLLSNAIRHSPQGADVTLRAEAGEREVVIEVTDTGAGIAADDVPKVFDRFWRADTSRSRHTGGTGLGLSIVRKLVEAHGGTVTVTSVPHEATTFRLVLPVTGPRDPADGGYSPATRSPGTSP